ncbi:hypothetical protein MAC_04388 [Metarhizium acridum CQMa 102]|uniref:Elongation of fatty acids protein n=1 Tax=Metarhizium acridum (strain CQMa 102) TaxID=655827 RepID=E9E3E0_METAQ|nr:uncharacterized protein MAC_04388 [Metarhizium acridum CQMa 102]EFY89533.1 hypothetical protein MAC_04388 [Metarhizium acridum CQMa 102]
MMSSATVRLSLSDSTMFQFPPRSEPETVPPPAPGSTLAASPFSIPASTFHAALDLRVPVTIGCIYATAVAMLNAYNRSHGNKPWRISKSRAFFWFVVGHNVLLATYSGWTFMGMLRAARRTVCNPLAPAGLAGTVDSLCKIHGAPGLGNAIAYNRTMSRWASESPLTNLLGTAGTPDPAHLGRFWNEGLAFYGWLFYLSKFYEVVDTAIIIARGKTSSTLQTYHHAGAMMCMWSGIRYMSPPIWMFVFVNSGIHALMYAYYTLRALSVAVPQALKRSLTTMQIMQFLFGASYAALHSFVSYTIPIQTSRLEDSAVEHHAGYQTVSCINTSGQTFAIWSNVLYLAPLTVLFVRFFVQSYFPSEKGGSKAP